MRRAVKWLLSGVAYWACVAGPCPALAEGWTDVVTLSGYVDSDIRYIVEKSRGLKAGEGHEFEMNRNDVDLRLDLRPFKKVRGVVEARLRFYGFNKAKDLPELVDREAIDPLSLQLDEAYVHMQGVLWEGLDIKIGRMVQTWGSADLFNQNDNLNARDFSDPLDYARKVPNQMIEIDLYPADFVTIQLAWVPVFKPAQLPPSASLAFALEYDDNGCFKSAPTPPLESEDVKKVYDLFEESGIDLCDINFVETSVRPLTPEFSMANSQAAARLGFMFGSFDFALGYYYGRFGFPVPYSAVAQVELNEGDPFDPENRNDDTFDVRYVAEVIYPRIHVASFDFSWSVEKLGGMGLIGEIAFYFPERVLFGFRTIGGQRLGLDEDLELSSQMVPAQNQSQARNPWKDTDFFIKATVGFDYTFTRWWYMNMMYVYGFFDEFNDMYGLHHYIVAAMELKFFDEELQIRLAAMHQMDGYSCALNPHIKWVVFPSAELTLGALIFLGDTEQQDKYDYASKLKFGQKAAGRSVAFLKARVSW